LTGFFTLCTLELMTKPASMPPDRDVLRQQEIAHQMSQAHSHLIATRAAAIRRLGELRAGVDILLDALEDSPEHVRVAAAGALGNFVEDARSAEITDALLSAIDDPSEKVCQSAIRSLGLLHAQEARPDIEAFLDDPNPYIVGAAILTLGRLKAKDLGPRFVEFLDHKSLYIQTQAVRAISYVGYTPAGPRLVEMIHQFRQARRSADHPTPQAFLDHQEDELYTILNHLLRTVSELKTREAISILTEIVQQDVGLRGLAVEALIATGADISPQMLSSLLGDPSIQLRRRVINLVSKARYRPALPLLRKMLEEDSAVMRSLALQAVTQMRDLEALPQIEWMCYHDTNPFTRIQAVHSLAAFVGNDEQERLLPLADDANFEVRRSAVTHLLENPVSNRAIARALARFAQGYPDDELNASIADALGKAGIDLTGTEEPASVKGISATLLPEAMRSDAPHLLDLLERWLRANSEDPAALRSLETQKLRVSLEYLIELLKRNA
jgi:HEAT repeat protein